MCAARFIQPAFPSQWLSAHFPGKASRFVSLFCLVFCCLARSVWLYSAPPGPQRLSEARDTRSPTLRERNRWANGFTETSRTRVRRFYCRLSLAAGVMSTAESTASHRPSETGTEAEERY